MKNISIKIIGLLTIIFFMTSCEKDIELNNPNASRKNVVNAIFTVDSTMKVVLYKSNLPLSSDDSFNIIKNATVEIVENGTTETLIFEGGDYIHYGEAEGSYLSNKIVETGKTYNLKISGSDIDDLKSTITIPSTPSVSNTQMKTTINGKELNFSLLDPASEDNFYEIAIFFSYFNKYFDGTDTVIEGPFFSQAYLEVKNDNQNPLEASQNGSLLLVTDEIFNGLSYNMSLSVSTGFEMYTDENGVLEEVVDEGLVIDNAVLQISTINKALYEYNLSIQKQIESSEDPFSEAVQIKSNIENGLGIFGARNTEYFPVEL